MPEDPIIPIITFDSDEITFDNCGYTWDTCGYKQKISILANAIDISGGMALVVEHGENNSLYSRLDIFPDISLSVKLTNPMFNEIGSHSMPFNLPASSHNLKVFGFPNRIERYTEFKNREYPMYIFAEGLNILLGVLVVTSARQSEIDCYFKSGNGDFWSAVKGKSLKDIELGESEEFTNLNVALAFMNDSVTKGYPDVPFAMFPLVNTGMVKDFKMEDLPLAAGAWRGTTMVNYWDPTTPGFLASFSALSPFLYVNYILDRLWDTVGYEKVKCFISENSELKRLVLYNNVAKWWQETPNGFYLTPLPGDRPNKFVYSDYVSEYSISSFISDIGKMFCAFMFVNDRLRSVKFMTFKDLINSGDSVPISKVISDIIIHSSDQYPYFFFLFENDDAAYHEDDIKDLDNKNMIASVLELASLPAINPSLKKDDICLVRSRDTFYIVTYDHDTSLLTEWKPYSRNIRKYYGVDAEDTLKISCSAFTLPVYYGNDIFHGNAAWTQTWPFDINYTRVAWPLAHQRTDYELQDPSLEISKDFTPRFLFYRGMQVDQSTPVQNYYPLGTFDVWHNHKFTGSGAKIPNANISLQWDTEYGLVNHFYKEYLQWKMPGPDKLEFEAWFDVTELAAIDFSKKYAINNNHMFLDSVEFALTPKGVTASKVTAYKI